jgi:regulator of nucleoside diphosphate kinase
MSISVGDICITRNDYERLLRLLEALPESSSADRVGFDFIRDLKKARKVDSKKIPPEFITMNSTFKLTDLGTGESNVYTLVFPDDADKKKGKISILSHEGAAALGARVGNVIRWKTSTGFKYLQISKIVYQPEASGHFDL